MKSFFNRIFGGHNPYKGYVEAAHAASGHFFTNREVRPLDRRERYKWGDFQYYVDTYAR